MKHALTTMYVYPDIHTRAKIPCLHANTTAHTFYEVQRHLIKQHLVEGHLFKRHLIKAIVD